MRQPVTASASLDLALCLSMPGLDVPNVKANATSIANMSSGRMGVVVEDSWVSHASATNEETFLFLMLPFAKAL
ncbi:hypothetical protein CEXT_792951 [Caerostris extrusa]|uniref:Uncharacterized protein n=1 Tax=Caerostris extrusa TaxID=172846 RepID=A0AAV4T1S0_CAEEX|nr:hypothetical protein CEXT_792951 [Caerostris extrusa]